MRWEACAHHSLCVKCDVEPRSRAGASAEVHTQALARTKLAEVARR